MVLANSQTCEKGWVKVMEEKSVLQLYSILLLHPEVLDPLKHLGLPRDIKPEDLISCLELYQRIGKSYQELVPEGDDGESERLRLVHDLLEELSGCFTELSGNFGPRPIHRIRRAIQWWWHLHLHENLPGAKIDDPYFMGPKHLKLDPERG